MNRSSFQIKGNNSAVLRDQSTERCIQFSSSYFKKNVDKLESTSKERQPEWLLPQQEVKDNAGFIYFYLTLSSLLHRLYSCSRQWEHNHWATSLGNLGRSPWVLFLHSHLQLMTKSCWFSSPNICQPHFLPYHCLTWGLLHLASDLFFF